jgi:hypothetical protein
MAVLKEYSVWASLTGYIGGTKSDGVYPRVTSWGKGQKEFYTPTGQPIEMVTDFKAQGGLEIDIPVAYPLTGVGVPGDAVAKGKETQRGLAWKKCAFNQLRKPALVRSGLMQELSLKRPEPWQELMTRTSREITQWFGTQRAYDPYETLCRRYPAHLTALKADGGLNDGSTYFPQSHPNFYVANFGKVTFSQTPATYETNVEAAVAGLTGAAGERFTAEYVRQMVRTATDLRIKQVMYNGRLVYVIILTPSLAADLGRDEEFQRAQRDADKRGKDNKALTGVVMGEYHGALILIDINCPGALVSIDSGYDATRGLVNYGLDDPTSLALHYTTTNRHLAFLVGASAVASAYARPLNFFDDDEDYTNKKIKAGSMVYGFERCDIYDNDGDFTGTPGYFYENTSSLIGCFWADKGATWVPSP